MTPRWKRWFACWLPGLIGHVTFAPRRVEYTPMPLPPGWAVDRETGMISGTPIEGSLPPMHVILTKDGWVAVRSVLVRRRRFHRTAKKPPGFEAGWPAR